MRCLRARVFQFFVTILKDICKEYKTNEVQFDEIYLITSFAKCEKYIIFRNC